MTESFPVKGESLSQDQIDIYAMDSVSNILWVSDQSLGEAPNLAMFIATAFPNDQVTARVVTQRALEFMADPAEMEKRRQEIFDVK